MDPITIGLALASQFAPGIIKYFTNSDTAGAVADKVIDIARTVTGRPTPEEALEVLRVEPALALQFKSAVSDATRLFTVAAVATILLCEPPSTLF